MVQGRWKITIDTPMGEKSGVLELLVNGASLTGSISDAEHHVAISHGKVEGNQLSWQAKLTKPMHLSFKFTAVIEGDRISGSARHMLGSASFSGTRI
jgi:aerobic carbon-monoxide dehydrogenase large subunit